MTTAAEWQALPRGDAPEIAFAGRSNAGKSSAINALTQRKRLAYVSRTPGRTQHINFFRLPSGALVADLPGYGHAAVPAAVRRRWDALLSRYLAERRSLVGLVLVMDARHPLTALDRRMLEWFLPTGRPVHALLTKADKLAAGARRHTLAEVEAVLTQDFVARGWRVGVQLFSSEDASGVVDAEKAIGAWLEGHTPIAAAHKERPRHQGE